MQRYTDGRSEVVLAASSYRELIAELCSYFPSLTEELICKHALAIDGIIIHTPLLESFHKDAELVFFAKIAGG